MYIVLDVKMKVKLANPAKGMMTIKKGEGFTIRPVPNALEVFLEFRNVNESPVFVRATQEEITFTFKRKKDKK